MEEIIQIYSTTIEQTEEFNRLKELKNRIDKEYSNLIVSLKNKQALYYEAEERPAIFDVEKAKKEFMTAKTNLYSKPLVKEYFELERKLNEMLKEDMRELESSISSHFKHSIL